MHGLGQTPSAQAGALSAVERGCRQVPPAARPLRHRSGRPLHSFLPRFAIIDTARENDAKRSRELCAAIRAGEIVVFDKAYLDFAHLFDLLQRGVFWVTRAKDNMACEVLKSLPVAGRILRDEIIGLRTASALANYPAVLRRITALVEIDGREVEMVFLTNNLEWSPASVADLYRCRWSRAS